MSSRWRYAFAFAFFGLFTIAALHAYMETAGYTPLPSRWGLLVSIACPANLLASYIFFDVSVHTPAMSWAWVYQAALNFSLYFFLGAFAAETFARKDSLQSERRYENRAFTVSWIVFLLSLVAIYVLPDAPGLGVLLEGSVLLSVVLIFWTFGMAIVLIGRAARTRTRSSESSDS